MGVNDYRRCFARENLDKGIAAVVCSTSLHSGHIGWAAGSSKWAYALRIGVCPARRRARRTASALLEVAVQSAFQDKFSCTMAVVRGLLDGGSVTVRRMRAFAVANEMVRGGVSVVVATAFANSSGASLPGMPL